MRTVITKKSIGITWDDQQIQVCIARRGIAEFSIDKIIRMDRELNEAGGSKNPLTEDLKSISRHIAQEIEISVMGLPENEIMYRMLSRPFSDRKKVAETIGPEVETLLPAFDSRLLMDFIIMGKSQEGNNRIQTFCTKFSAVEGLLEHFKGSIFDPEIIDCPSVALAGGARALLDLPLDRPTVLFHMGWKESSLAVLDGKDIVAVGSLPYGFERIINAVVSEQGLTRKLALDKAKISKIAAGDKMTSFFREILILLDKNGISRGEGVLVPAGYAILLSDLESTSEEILGLPVHFPQVPVHCEEPTRDLFYGFLCASLACRAFDSTDAVNFRQGELGISKRMKMMKGYTGAWIKAAVLLLILWIAGLGLDVALKAHLNKNLTRMINAEFVSVMPKNTPLIEPEKVMEQYLRKLTGQSGTLRGKDTPLEILRDLSAGIQAGTDVVLDNINIDEENITLTGSTGSYENVNVIKKTLTGLPYVKDVKDLSAIGEKGDQKVRLKLICKK